jgi:hypothetical protein
MMMIGSEKLSVSMKVSTYPCNGVAWNFNEAAENEVEVDVAAQIDRVQRETVKDEGVCAPVG